MVVSILVETMVNGGCVHNIGAHGNFFKGGVINFRPMGGVIKTKIMRGVPPPSRKNFRARGAPNFFGYYIKQLPGALK